MLGLDTNILIRYIVQDDPVQSPLVSKFLKKECTEQEPCYISNIVLCEIVWVLESSYNYEREQVAETLKLIFETGNCGRACEGLVCIRGLSSTKYGFF